jgi:RND superfamily putative drug exporter
MRLHERFGISEGPAEPAAPIAPIAISLQHNGHPVGDRVTKIGG